MDISEIRKLIKLIQSSDVTEIEVSEGETTVRISRQGMVATMAPTMMAAPVAAAPIAAPVAAHAAAAPAAAPAAAESEHTVKSPMVGTYYSASSPDADPFVKEGKSVKKGDVLCIVEAMKLMNEIEAEYDGVVQEILVKNAQPVEYGQPLFVITPA